MSSSFGQVFRISTWGESHGTGVGVVIDGCPSLVPVTEEDIQRELDRRRPGQSDIVTPRREEDRAGMAVGAASEAMECRQSGSNREKARRG